MLVVLGDAVLVLLEDAVLVVLGAAALVVALVDLLEPQAARRMAAIPIAARP